MVNMNQFGYDAAYYYYVKYLSKHYYVDYCCLYKNRKKIKYCGRYIKYFKNPENKIKYLVLIFKIGLYIRKNNYDHIIYRNSKFAFLIKFISSQESIYDVRTLSVNSSIIKRFITNSIIKINILFFEKIFVISPYIIDELRTNKKKVYIIPLGAEHKVERKKSKISDLKLLYVGTLYNRNIHETIKGAIIFAKAHPKIKIIYTIIGEGNDDNLIQIEENIKNSPRNLKVVLKKLIPHHKLYKHLSENNIGVSYIPMRKCYFPQPATKTYEYLLAGMVVIATALPSNNDVITDENGVIINDNPKAFVAGLSKLYRDKNSYNLNEIAKSSLNFHWEKIIEQKLIKALNDIKK